MTPPDSAVAQLVEQFKRSWAQESTPPKLEIWLRAVPLDSPTAAWRLAAEDLEQRWRRWGGQAVAHANHHPVAGLPRRPRLEDYAQQFPQRLPREAISKAIILVEYRSRAVELDRPEHDEYVARFGDRFPAIATWLTEADQQSAAAAERVPAPVQPVEVDATTDVSRKAGADTSTAPSEVRPDPSGRSADQERSVATKHAATFVGKRIGGYELLSEVARGGMGVVYKARQVNLNRMVAVKMILAGQLAGEQEIRRFHSEAEAAARLDHPHIVPVYEVGEHEGRHFYSMGYVDGHSLKDSLAEGPVSPEQAARIVRQVASAVQFAHERGIIHRDLKPANILLDRQGQPLVTDFGLAKVIEQDSGLTLSGQILGTPSYMPPEQALGRGNEVGPHSDVYALGAVLYCALTGRPPFQAATPTATLDQLIHREPAPPRQLNPAVPRDLEIVCLKCLEKIPAKRLPSARDLVDELDRYLRGEPVVSRPVGSGERLLRWCRRNRVVAGLSIATAATLVLGTVISLYLAAAAQKNAQLASQRASQLEQQRNLANEAAERARLQERRADREARSALRLASEKAELSQLQSRQLVRLNVARGLDQLRLGNQSLSLPWFAAALGLEQSDARREAVHRLRMNSVLERNARLVQLWVKPGLAHFLEMSDDGKFLATTGRTEGGKFSPNGGLGAWNATTGESLDFLPNREDVLHVAFRKEQNHLAMLDRFGRIQIWDLDQAKLLAKSEYFYSQEGSPILHHLAFSPNGQTLLAYGYDSVVYLLDPNTLRLALPVLQVSETSGNARYGVFSHDSRFVFVMDFVGTIGAWETQTGERQSPPIPDGKPVAPVGMLCSKHGELILSREKSVQVWSLPEEKVLQESIPGQLHDISSDHQRVLMVAGDAAQLWTIKTGKPHAKEIRNDAPIRTAAISPEGDRIATGDGNHAVRVWNAATGTMVGSSLWHSAPVQRVRFGKNGATVITACADGTVRVWELPRSVERTADIQLPGPGDQVLFRPDGHVLVTRHGGDTVQLWHADTRQAIGEPITFDAPTTQVDISSDGRYLVVATTNCEIFVHDCETGERLWGPLRPEVTRAWEGKPARRRMTFSLAGELLLAGCGFEPEEEMGVAVWSLATGNLALPEMTVRGTQLQAASFIQGGSRFAVTLGTAFFSNSKIHLFETATALPAGEPIALEWHPEQVAFDAQGRRFAASLKNRTIPVGRLEIWDVASRRLSGDIAVGAEAFQHVGFRPDGGVLLSVQNTELQLRDPATGQHAVAPLRHASRIRHVEFSSDSQFLVSIDGSSNAFLWDAQTGQQVMVLPHPRTVLGAAFSPDGRWLVTSCQDGTVWFWDLTPTRVPTDQLLLLAPILAGHFIDDTDSLSPLGAQQCERQWAELLKRFPERRSPRQEQQGS